ncbi:MAG TPA: ABC transporter ATP-binding protein, partial [bacterium]|nr:ABC transporter ATP-binding protein [bacterium]
LGENGAGKSTLLSILAGLYRPDAGTIRLDARTVDFRSPRDAIACGIGMVHQHFKLIDAFTVTENILLGWHAQRFRLNTRAEESNVQRMAADHGLGIDSQARVWQLSVGERQRVEIAKMLYRDARVLILDEPTAVLTPQEVQQLFVAIRRIARQGRAVVFISHKLDEVLAIADQIVVLRAGRVAGRTRPDATTPRALAQLMVGHEIDAGPRPAGAPGAEILALDGVVAHGDRGHRALHVEALTIREGEVVGVAGVAGNGQRELAEVVTGLRPAAVGRVALAGRDMTTLGARERFTRGIAYIPEDRLGEGLIGAFTVTDNMVLRDYASPPISRGPFFKRGEARAKAAAIVDRFQVRAANLDAPVRHLSGGNQQRLLVGRETWARPRVLVAVHPTRGLDIDATAAVHRILLALRAAGVAILLISESLEELFALSDRIAVLHRGRIVGERPAATATREEIGMMMAGGTAA